MSNINIDLIKGLTFGFEYIDDYEDGEGSAFLMIFHLGLIRIVIITETHV